MNQELVFETHQLQTVIRADSLHTCLGVVTDLRLWVVMHTAAGEARLGVDVFHKGPPESACWSLAFAAEVAVLEAAPELAAALDQAASPTSPVQA
ncbi:hypothetical protein [Deinococcus soli (ex Cha et al. 2016)]|uniref:Uncharacterized protein n=2 Tax=Deinococcus soli (ex Cha et al. 2016) TaxID=1309411 RepID=A0AAE3XG39_9DEIO|nr:hypothetical protein [Deinococcus soli (ex Cha et al. 2016)]MDR6219849.1 hypothetical protein [Deinococcus soli (ex Cha et al. 2016)]MDR6329893.1 hypothetical protein [Deinococcus soli (ex Cha et al. 2016)]MDR6752756.1 hypothetical protein [Deinococcus soli (ex Cha et al. 2016)]